MHAAAISRERSVKLWDYDDWIRGRLLWPWNQPFELRSINQLNLQRAPHKNLRAPWNLRQRHQVRPYVCTRGMHKVCCNYLSNKHGIRERISFLLWCWHGRPPHWTSCKLVCHFLRTWLSIHGEPLSCLCQLLFLFLSLCLSSFLCRHNRELVIWRSSGITCGWSSCHSTISG